MDKNTTISVLGCGWLGLPLAQRLVKEKYIVKGSTTNTAKFESIISSGIAPFLIELNTISPTADVLDFLNSDVLIINVPPGTRKPSGSQHLKHLENLLEVLRFSNIKQLIYVSSTSVYPDLNRLVFEQDVVTVHQAENKIIAEAEQMILNHPGTYNLILRCAGLAGYDRMLARFFAGKANLPGRSAPVNLIHRDDVVQIILQFLKQQTSEGIFNLCAPCHPTKMDLYTKEAAQFNLEPPVFANSESENFKIIDSSKMINTLNYQFIFPDPFHFTYTFK